MGETRKVPVEIIRNGEVVDRREIEADGQTLSITSDIDIPESSWVAVRILPSVHTNPIWVQVGDQPIRVSKSADWCTKAVDICWERKKRKIRESELPAAEAAYQKAKAYYEALVAKP